MGGEAVIRGKKRMLLLLAAGAVILLVSCGRKENEPVPEYASAQLSESTSEPAESTAEPAESTSEPVESAAEPAESSVESTESAVGPAESIADPVESAAEPAENTAESAESTAESAVSAAEPAQSEAPAEGEEEAPVDDFYITEITDELFERIRGKSFKEDCTLPREDLRYLHVLHRDLDGEVHEGEMICNYHIAEDVLQILRELYEAEYPIERIRLVDEYGADDELSMEDNNSSCFNFRFISHTSRVSKHGLGLAVDINTLYNPYVKEVDGTLVIEPSTGETYTDREGSFPYKITGDDLCCRLFREHGFEWGGDWTNRKDYQHFEIPDSVIAEWYP